jgi:hypothetical protein
MKIKNLLTVLFLFISLTNNAQLIELSKLSTGKFYDSSVIKDNKSNIKGYFLLYESEKVKKETFNLEYVVLDENLTKVTSGFIEEMKFSSFLINAKKIKVDVTLYNNNLLIELTDAAAQGDFFRRYRILDLKSNKMSDIVIFKKGKIEVNPLFDRTLKNFSDNQTDKIIGLNDIGLIAIKDQKEENDKNKYIVCLDNDFKEKWKTTYEVTKNENGFKELSFLNSSKDYIVLFNHYTKSANYTCINSILTFDANTGKTNFEYLFPNQNKFTYKIVDSYIQNEEILLLGNYSKKSNIGFISDEENIGLFKIRLNLKTGKTIEEKYLNWTELASKIDINKNGKIKNEGYVFVHNLIKLEDDKIIAVCETFKNLPITTNNIYFITISSKFSFDTIFGIEKFKNKFPRTTAHSRNIKLYGLFDFMDYQNLDDDEFLFYFSDNEKNSRNRNKSTVFGIVSYTDGLFKKQSLNLKTETSTIFAYPAKKGYIMLIEAFDSKNKSPEIRLEKATN